MEVLPDFGIVQTFLEVIDKACSYSCYLPHCCSVHVFVLIYVKVYQSLDYILFYCNSVYYRDKIQPHRS